MYNFNKARDKLVFGIPNDNRRNSVVGTFIILDFCAHAHNTNGGTALFSIELPPESLS